ncbi:MAG: hypothetical protein ABSF76_01915 [Opitutaceae bacterium]|jgi:hypothetical protein
MKIESRACRRFLFCFLLACSGSGLEAQPPINVSSGRLAVSVDPSTCRWSASVIGTPMQLNDVYFLPNDDPSGWTVSGSVNPDDSGVLGSFLTVTLRGEKPGQLDFEYQISVSKTGTDLLVSLGRSNSTGHPVDLDDMDTFVSNDARLGGTTDKWISLGTQSRNRDYYELWSVIHLITPRTYAVNHVVRDADTGNSLLLGHVTTLKGASRFEVAEGWTGKIPDRMRVRGYCSYKVTIPPGKGFPGEKLLIDFNTDALRAMEHQADLIAAAHDVRLKERRPIDLNDRELVANNYSRFHGWMSGGSNAKAAAFFKANGLDRFYYGMGGPAPQQSWGLYGSGGSTQGRPSRVNYPKECYLPIHTPKYEGERVIDFSNPLTVRLERERAFRSMVGHEGETGRVEMDFADWWDKWPGQFDPFQSALETYRAAGLPWREAIDQKAPRMVIRSNMQPVDHSYGLVDICRVSEDADHGYEEGFSQLAGIEFTGLFAETVFGSANRFFYNGRVFWNDGDGFHIYKYNSGGGGLFTAGQARVDACFHAIAGSTLFVSEAFDVPYPEDRVELLKRISPPTMDTSYPVDLFVRKPAQVWNMPIVRPFGKWCVVSVFNFTDLGKTGRGESEFTTSLDAAKDLRLDPGKEYIAYEFWSARLVGTFKGTFNPRPLNPYDCAIYSIVERQDHPVLVSTSRHIRQMAVDIKDLAYDSGKRMLRGVSRAVAGDPYQLRIYVPDGFKASRVEVSGGLTATLATEGPLLKVDYTSTSGDDVEWKVFF